MQTTLEARNHLELMLHRIEEMRKYQIAYFARRQEYDKKMAMSLERQVDKMIVKLRAMGYDGSRYTDKTSQGKLL